MISRNRKHMLDTRKYEQTIADSGAVDYEKGLSGWTLEHRYFIAPRWAKTSDGLFLDYGCGTGLVARNLLNMGREVLGVDISRNMCKIARKSFGIQVVVADGFNLPFKDKTFDVVCVSGVLHHLRLRLKEAFLEISRCARNYVCIIEPSTTPPSIFFRVVLFLHKAYWWISYHLYVKRTPRKYRYSIYEGPLDPQRVRTLFEKNGFHVSEMRFFNHFPSMHALPERFRKHLIHSMISSTRGTDVEIIATVKQPL